MPFRKDKKGSKANQKGSARTKARNKELAQELLKGSVQAAVDAINNALDSDDPAWAAKMVFEYVYGKPAQQIELGNKEGVSFKIVIGGND